MPDTLPKGFRLLIGDNGATEFEVGLGELARWANRSDETILKLVKEGVVQRHGRGRYRLRASLKAMDAHRQDDRRETTESAARARVADARARAIELRMAEAERALLPLDDVLLVIDFFVGWFVQTADGLAGRVTDDLTLRSKIQDEVDTMLNGVSDRADKARKALEEGRDPFEAPRSGRARK